MSLDLLDNPLLLSVAFYPRPAEIGDGLEPSLRQSGKIIDGVIPVEGDIVLGYRLFVHEPGAPVILFHHGNGEIAPDYTYFAPEYHDLVGASLLVVDFRGYGWSTGRPTFRALLSDTEAVLKALPEILAKAGLANSPLFAMGRSMGSAPTIHMAHEHPECFRGIIIESGFADLLSVMVRLGYPAHLLGNIVDPVANMRKMGKIDLPLLIIHGEADTLIPVQHAQRLYEAAVSKQKTLLRVPHAGHNNLLAVASDQYFTAIKTFIS